jgi:hypothetical protein
MDIIERKTVHKLGRVKIELQRVLDDSPDTSWLGEFCNYDSRHTPRTSEQKLVHRQSGLVLDHSGIWRDSKGRIAAEPEHRSYAREYQYTFHNNGHEKLSYALHDNRRLEQLNNGDICILGVRALVQFQGVVIGESSIWGIESDSDESYFAETETEQIKEALAEAKAFRKELAS